MIFATKLKVLQIKYSKSQIWEVKSGKSWLRYFSETVSAKEIIGGALCWACAH